MTSYTACTAEHTKYGHGVTTEYTERRHTACTAARTMQLPTTCTTEHAEHTEHTEHGHGVTAEHTEYTEYTERRHTACIAARTMQLPTTCTTEHAEHTEHGNGVTTEHTEYTERSGADGVHGFPSPAVAGEGGAYAPGEGPFCCRPQGRSLTDGYLCALRVLRGKTAVMDFAHG